MQRRRSREKADLWLRFQRLISELLLEEHVPAEDRFEGLIMAMRAHGLPCDPAQVEKIRKLWNECVAARQKHRRKT
jgi:hypothetical protein